MNVAFKGQLAAGLLLALALMKILMTGVTLGCGGAGGVFAPAMFIGAVFGGGFASLVNVLIPGTIGHPGEFALIGMGAFLAAATHAPLTAIFLLIDMTHAYEVVVPIMITGVTATLVSRRLLPDSIDSYDLTRRGLDIHAGSEANILRNLYVRGLVRKEFQQIPESMAVSDFVRYLTNSHHVHFPVVNKSGELTGIISMEDLRDVLLKREAWPFVVVAELADKEVETVKGSDSLYHAMKVFTARGLEQLVVVDEDNPKKVVGMLSRSELQSFYQKRLLARELHG
jgi:CIC family chloride channel protein